MIFFLFKENIQSILLIFYNKLNFIVEINEEKLERSFFEKKLNKIEKMKKSIILNDRKNLINENYENNTETLLEANEIIFSSENSNNSIFENFDKNKNEENFQNSIIKNTENYKKINTKKYKFLLEIIENHLKNPKNFMNQIKELFIKDFIKKNEFYAHEITDDFIKLTQKLEILYFDIKNFIKIFTETILIYYQISLFQKIIEKELYDLIYSENFNNFITCIIFDERIYSLLFEIQKKIDISKENILENYISKKKQYNPIEKINIFGKFLIKNEENFEHCIKCLKVLQFFTSPIQKIQVIV